MGYYSFRGRSPPLRPPAPAVLRLVARRLACGAGLQRAHPRQQARVRLARSDRQEGPGPALPGVVVQAVRDRVGGAGARRGALPRARRRGPGTPRPGHHRRRAALRQRTERHLPRGLDPRLTIANRFGFNGTPYTVVVDRRGEMVARIHGESAVNRLPRILDGLVG